MTVTWACLRRLEHYARRSAVVLGTLVAAGACAHNTLDPTGDGRLFLLLDMGPERASGSVVQIDLEVEGMDPRRLIVFDKRRPPPAGGGVYIDVSEAIDWLSIQGAPHDMVGRAVPGGAEVRVYIRTNEFDTNEMSFRLDGNTMVRLYVANPEIPGMQHIEMQLTLQQVF